MFYSIYQVQIAHASITNGRYVACIDYSIVQLHAYTLKKVKSCICSSLKELMYVQPLKSCLQHRKCWNKCWINCSVQELLKGCKLLFKTHLLFMSRY